MNNSNNTHNIAKIVIIAVIYILMITVVQIIASLGPRNQQYCFKYQYTNISKKTIIPQTLILPYNYRLFASDIFNSRTGGGTPPTLAEPRRGGVPPLL